MLSGSEPTVLGQGTHRTEGLASARGSVVRQAGTLSLCLGASSSGDSIAPERSGGFGGKDWGSWPERTLDASTRSG